MEDKKEEQPVEQQTEVQHVEEQQSEVQSAEVQQTEVLQSEQQAAKSPSDHKKFLKGALVGALAMLVLVAALGVAGYCFLFRGTGTTSDGKIVSTQMETKLELIRGLIDQFYLYDVNNTDVQNGLYEGYVKGLNDPYSVYYDEEATKDLLEGTSGKYSGVGAVLMQDASTGYVQVTRVYDGSPAKQAGLQAGDLIYQIDDKEITDEDLTEIVSWIKGEEGTDVTLHVYRGADLETAEIKATRATITAQTVNYEMKENSVGYIQVLEFDSVTYDQFNAALTDLESQNMAGLIIDLRANPGGDVDVTCDMLRLLLPKGTIVYTKDKNGEKQEYECDGKHEFTKPLAVLVDGYSASASEIFSGAIQDYGIGKLVGTTTYGKGVVQELMNLQDGTYLKVTIAEYFTPKGRNINKKGLNPDVEVEYAPNAADAAADNQLDKAMEVVGGQLQ